MHHPSDLWVGGLSVTELVAIGGDTIPLPTLDAGDGGVPGATDTPKRCLITTDGNGVWIQIGLSGVTVNQHEEGSEGVMIHKFAPQVLVTAGQTHIAFRGESSLIVITPLND